MSGRSSPFNYLTPRAPPFSPQDTLGSAWVNRQSKRAAVKKRQHQVDVKKGLRARASVAWEFIVSFLEVSSVHGFNHLVARKRTLTEYMLWVVALVLGVWGAVWISLSTWRRYQENPTVISMERNYQEWNTSFPAVTICPFSTVEAKRLEELVASYSDAETKKKVRRFLEQLSSSTYSTFNNIDAFPENPIAPEDFLKFVHQSRFNFMYEVTNSIVGLEEHLTPTWTEVGICYTYNSNLAIYNGNSYWEADNWTILPEFGIIYGNPLDGDLYSQVTKMNSGSKVFVHSCNDVPDAALRPMSLPANTYKTVDMNALTIYSTEDTRHLSVKQRKCRFVEESDLAISPVYSYNLCRMNCRRRLSIDLCKCTPHFYRLRPSDNAKVCDIQGLQCLYKHAETLVKLFNYETKKKIECNCLPPCNDVTFGLELEQDMPWFLGTYIKWGVTKYPRMRLKRDILFGFSDLLVSIGGTAGLFLGCSVLSFIEIFYFFTIRLGWYICQNVQGHKNKRSPATQDN